MKHEHDYTYKGVVFAIGERLPGSGAREVTYYDHYFCLRCLHHEYQRLSVAHDSYSPIRFGATPKPEGAPDE